MLKQFFSADIGIILYIQGPWKKKNLADFGIVNQCMCPLRVNDNYLGNIMLKINAKVYSYGSVLMLTSCEATFYM